MANSQHQRSWQGFSWYLSSLHTTQSILLSSIQTLFFQIQLSPTMYQCCGRSFEAKGMRKHLDNSYAHSNEIECHWCFARWPTHASKLRLKHEMDNHWHHCKDCTWRFKTEELLQVHIDDEHPPNYCYGCQRAFQTPNNLNQVALVLHLKSSQLTQVLSAPQIIGTRRKKRQVSLVH